jgi:hypothetical protein
VKGVRLASGHRWCPILLGRSGLACAHALAARRAACRLPCARVATTRQLHQQRPRNRCKAPSPRPARGESRAEKRDSGGSLIGPGLRACLSYSLVRPIMLIPIQPCSRPIYIHYKVNLLQSSPLERSTPRRHLIPPQRLWATSSLIIQSAYQTVAGVTISTSTCLLPTAFLPSSLIFPIPARAPRARCLPPAPSSPPAAPWRAT